MIQQLVPEFQVKHVVSCRGTNRIRPPQMGWAPRDIPLRKTVVVQRDGTGIAVDGDVEEWSRIPRYKQHRKGIPARLSMTAYGTKGVLRTAGSTRGHETPENQGAVTSESSNAEESSSGEVRPTGLIDGFPPKAIPKHGPAYLSLSEEDKITLSRLHNNLGHPAAEVLVKFLTERKAEPYMIQAARDFSCSVCLETVSQPKLSRPAKIHVDGDFGDVVGMDVAYWTNSEGRTFMFTHILDEATLFQQAEATGRTSEEQFEALADHWFQWAGPCKTLYVDPAGEYTGDVWRDRLQQEGVRAHVSAGEAHWQLGRVEAHGKILKGMLTRMDKQEPIRSEAAFRLCLRQAVLAKNSLSRVKGFTPEQAVFGKMSRLPASLISDSKGASHALASSESPEGVAFRQSLQRREQARVAFVQSDNDNAYRRAMLRRSRPACNQFEAGDWVLYWRRNRGGQRAEHGRWYGPAQVICGDPKVVWVSHCGRLVRAAPEQLRSASMREWQSISQSNEPPRVEATRGVLDLAGQGELPSRSDVEQQGDSAIHPAEAEGNGISGSSGAAPANDGDMEMDLPETPQRASGTLEAEPVAPEQPEMEVSPAVSEDLSPDPMDVPLPDDEDDLLFGDTGCFLAYPGEQQAWEITIHETEVPYQDLPSATEAFQYVMLATQEKKKRVEVRLKDLTPEEREKFVAAKGKEVKAWIDHRAVRRVAPGTLDDRQIMRCRWVLTWKPPEHEGGARRAKARLVVLGFEDPDLQTVPNDAPTLGKDARQLLLQKVVSNRWRLINFDISSAFLQGQGDGRLLGVKPPEEIQKALGMKRGDQCQLDGGAYGRVDAPFLWFKTLKQTLENLGFIQSPFDACTFLLVTPGTQEEPKVHGVLGIHVDDGIGGGDKYFSLVVQKLREIYSFGSYDEGEFIFTGIRFRQWDDGSVEMDQVEYVEKIQPIHIPRNRRTEPSEKLRPDEVSELRRLNGSLQYAAVHARPDICAKVGALQSAIPRAEVRHLIEANRVLHEAKSHHMSLMIVPIEEANLTFCTFSDASFATSKDNNSYQGTLVVATDWKMLENRQAVIVPMAWSSKKISRVVRSTLSAEVVALSGSVDRMSWLRLFWEWFKSPNVDLTNPDEILRRAPESVLVTDCKSAYDISTKTAVPSCVELRTQLECLLLRERLQENCRMRWVHSKAMLADCLTKVMDSSYLRESLSKGTYALVDESDVLESRAGKRQSLKWLRNVPNTSDKSLKI